MRVAHSKRIEAVIKTYVLQERALLITKFIVRRNTCCQQYRIEESRFSGFVVNTQDLVL